MDLVGYWMKNEADYNVTFEGKKEPFLLAF